MSKYKLGAGAIVTLFLGLGAIVSAGEPSGIGEKGTGQTQKSTERQQSMNKSDMSQVPEELREGKSAQAMEELTQEQQANRSITQEPSGIGEKGTGQTNKSTERQQSKHKPDMSQVPEELREGRTAQAIDELMQEKQNR